MPFPGPPLGSVITPDPDKAAEDNTSVTSSPKSHSHSHSNSNSTSVPTPASSVPDAFEECKALNLDASLRDRENVQALIDHIPIYGAAVREAEEERKKSKVLSERVKKLTRKNNQLQQSLQSADRFKTLDSNRAHYLQTRVSALSVQLETLESEKKDLLYENFELRRSAGSFSGGGGGGNGFHKMGYPPGVGMGVGMGGIPRPAAMMSPLPSVQARRDLEDVRISQAKYATDLEFCQSRLLALELTVKLLKARGAVVKDNDVDVDVDDDDVSQASSSMSRRSRRNSVSSASSSEIIDD